MNFQCQSFSQLCLHQGIVFKEDYGRIKNQIKWYSRLCHPLLPEKISEANECTSPLYSFSILS